MIFSVFSSLQSFLSESDGVWKINSTNSLARDIVKVSPSPSSMKGGLRDPDTSTSAIICLFFYSGDRSDKVRESQGKQISRLLK